MGGNNDIETVEVNQAQLDFLADHFGMSAATVRRVLETDERAANELRRILTADDPADPAVDVQSLNAVMKMRVMGE